MTMGLIYDSANPEGRAPTAEEQADYAARAAAHAAGATGRALASLAAKRWAVETGGCAVPSLGFRVRTDREAIAMLSGVVLAVQAGAAPAQIPWKALDGFHVIAPADVAAIFGAVVAHQAAAFGREAALAAEIAVAEDPEAVDIATGWPAND